MKLETEKTRINKPAEITYNFLSDVRNFEKLMPDSIEKFTIIDEDTFLFALKGMPQITLRKKSALPHNRIEFGAAGGKIDFSLVGIINEIDDSTSEVSLEFNGEFNPMMSMMIKKPIKNFIDTLSNKIPFAI